MFYSKKTFIRNKIFFFQFSRKKQKEFTWILKLEIHMC